MKKILVNFVALHGGGTADAFQMVNGLCENNCDVYAILNRHMENIERWKTIKGLHIFEVNGYTNKINFYPRLLLFKLLKLGKIKKEIKRIGVDAVYIPMISFWTYAIFKRFKKYRTIYTMHDVRPHDEKTNTIIWKQSQKIASQCSEIVILSNCFRDEVKKEYQKTDDKIYTLPLGYQSYYHKETKNTALHDGKYHFVFYGRVDDYKGLDILAKAYKQISDKYEKVHLLVAASGNFEPYNDLYQNIDKEKLTIINRWIKDEEVCSFFDTEKNITLLPYKNATQSGIIPIAMSNGSLVIATSCSGLKEQVEDKKTGLLIEPNSVDSLVNAMEYVMSNWEEAKKMIDNATKYIGQLSWNSIAGRLLEKI